MKVTPGKALPIFRNCQSTRVPTLREKELGDERTKPEPGRRVEGRPGQNGNVPGGLGNGGLQGDDEPNSVLGRRPDEKLE